MVRILPEMIGKANDPDSFLDSDPENILRNLPRITAAAGINGMDMQIIIHFQQAVFSAARRNLVISHMLSNPLSIFSSACFPRQSLLKFKNRSHSLSAMDATLPVIPSTAIGCRRKDH